MDTYANAHMTTTSYSELGVGANKRLQALGQLSTGLWTEDTSWGQDLGVGPKILRFIFVDITVVVENGIAKGLG